MLWNKHASLSCPAMVAALQNSANDMQKEDSGHPYFSKSLVFVVEKCKGLC